MKKMTKVLLTASILPVLLGSASAFAKGGKDDDRGQRGDRDFRGSEQCEQFAPRKMMSELNLTEEQQTKLRDLRKAERDDMDKERQAHRQQMLDLRKQENQIIMAKDFDAQAADKLAKQMVEQQAAMRDEFKTTRHVEMMKHRFEMMSILTPEQKTKFVELQDQRMDKMADCDFRPGQGPDHRGSHGPMMGNGPRN